MHTKEEPSLIERCQSPDSIQSYLDSLAYDWSLDTYIRRSFRRTVQDQMSACLCSALTAAHLLESHEHEPVIMVLYGPPSSHTVAVYHQDGHIGTVAKSRYDEGKGKPPSFGSESELAESYASFYRSIGFMYDQFGLIDLRKLGIDWRFNERI
tara:strand:+ start:91 stop:549 length:459 start_codon:yes stop_codon:yes gene_type:complete